jgi:hypothetical protein
MHYTADSVQEEINVKTKNVLTVKGDARCPQSTAWIGHANMPCPSDGSPTSCLNVQNEDHECKQTVYVYPQGGGAFLAVLTFYFTVSKTDHNGYIDENDLQLKWLISRGQKSGRYTIDDTQFREA